ncbi:MAG TPA: DUF1697 domain-containing protein [Bryobacteraceae bacterium]|nr:DUF1697 domain-containing protein [Bryobacteraceae bacterium]
MPKSTRGDSRVIALLRGVNVGGNNKLPMATLREICASMGLNDTATYIQSGNIVFTTTRKDLPKLATDLELAIQAQFGFRPAVILRTAAELAAVIAASPFAGRANLNPGYLVVTFYPHDPGDEARRKLMALDHSPEELHALNRETYVYFANGQGQTKMKFNAIDKILGAPGTGRNWNTVNKLLEMATAL